MGYLFYPVALSIAGITVGVVSATSGFPLWLLLVPFLALLRGPYDMIGAFSLGIGVDVLSGHPLGTTTLLLGLIAFLLRRAGRHLEDAPLLQALLGGAAGIAVLFGLLLSRVLVLSFGLVPVSMLPLLQQLFTIRVLFALLSSTVAVFVTSRLIRRPGFSYG